MSTTTILKTARAIVARKGYWTRGAMATKGSFCALGAVAAADGRYALTYNAAGKRVAVATDPKFYIGQSLPTHGELSEAAEQALGYLSASLKLGPSAPKHRDGFIAQARRVSSFNDDRTNVSKKRVLAMFDRAIARSKRA